MTERPEASEGTGARLPVRQYAILFTNLQGSSVLNQRIGDVVYKEEVLYPHFRQMQQAASSQAGHQSGAPAGDSMMFVFAEIAQAIEAAVTIQEFMRDHPATLSDGSPVATRIGIHYSKKQLSQHVDFGFSGNSDCNYAARVMGIAQGGQILLSQEAYEAAQSRRTDWKLWPNRLIKSFEETPRTVYELCWDVNTSKGEPGAQFLPDWYVLRNEYIPRSTLEAEIIGYFNPKRPDSKFSRLVTLHGFGGMGKTRLAMQCAVQMVGVFEGRVYFVALGRMATELVTDEASRCGLLSQSIGKAFAPERDPATPETLLQSVPTTTTLLLLDNWETVEGTPSAALIASLLTNRPHLTILATGRQCVHIDDMEQEVEVEGMSLSEAQALFLARLRQKQEYAHWTPTPPDEAILHSILKTLEGHALAIELVAANAAGRLLSSVAQEIERRVLSENTARRQGHISGENAPRHASLQASLDWSWELLTPSVRYALCCLGLFAQPFTETDARAIFPQLTLQSMMGLREAALMQFRPTDSHPYSLLRVTREYAQEKCSTLDAHTRDEIEDHFLQHYSALMQRFRQGVYDHYSPTLAILDTLHADAVAAFVLAIERNDPEMVAPLYATLTWYQTYRSLLTENRSLEERMLAFQRKVLPESHPRIATSLNNLAGLYDTQGRYAEAEPLYQEALQIKRAAQPEGHPSIATSFNNLASLYDTQGRYEEAEPLYQEALTICWTALPQGHPSIATSLNNLALLYQTQGRYKEAEPLFQEALKIDRAALPEGHPHIAIDLNNLAGLYQTQGRYEEAEPLYQEALKIVRVGLGEDHPNTKTIAENYAILQQRMKNGSQADMDRHIPSGSKKQPWWKRLFGR